MLFSFYPVNSVITELTGVPELTGLTELTESTELTEVTGLTRPQNYNVNYTLSITDCCRRNGS